MACVTCETEQPVSEAPGVMLLSQAWPVPIGTARVMILHDDMDQDEVWDALRRRWPAVVAKRLAQEMPPHNMLAVDAAQLGQCRRGIEPLRIVIMPQHDLPNGSSTIIEPMPVLV